MFNQKLIHKGIHDFLKGSLGLFKKEQVAKKVTLAKQLKMNKLITFGSVVGLLGGIGSFVAMTLFNINLILPFGLLTTISIILLIETKQDRYFLKRDMRNSFYQNIHSVLINDINYLKDENGRFVTNMCSLKEFRTNYFHNMNIAKSLFATLLVRLNIAKESDFLYKESAFTHNNLIIFADNDEVSVIDTNLLVNPVLSKNFDLFSMTKETKQMMSIQYTSLLQQDKEHVLKVQNDILKELIAQLPIHNEFVSFYKKYFIMVLFKTFDIPLTEQNFNEMKKDLKDATSFSHIANFSYESLQETMKSISLSDPSSSDIQTANEESTPKIESTVSLSALDKQLLSELDNLRHNEALIEKIDTLKQHVIQFDATQSEAELTKQKETEFVKIENYFKEKNYISA